MECIAPLSMEFSRKKHWDRKKGVPGVELRSPASQANSLPPELTSSSSTGQASSRTVAGQAPLSMEFSRQEYWSGLLCPPPGDLPDPGIKPMSPASPALAGGFFTTEPPGKPLASVVG